MRCCRSIWSWVSVRPRWRLCDRGRRRGDCLIVDILARSATGSVTSGRGRGLGSRPSPAGVSLAPSASWLAARFDRPHRQRHPRRAARCAHCRHPPSDLRGASSLRQSLPTRSALSSGRSGDRADAVDGRQLPWFWFAVIPAFSVRGVVFGVHGPSGLLISRRCARRFRR